MAEHLDIIQKEDMQNMHKEKEDSPSSDHYELSESETETEESDSSQESEPNAWSIIWSFLKQVHFGADLTRISVPSAICLPSSFLQTLGSKILRGVDVLPMLATVDNPLSRMLFVVRFYLSILTREEFAKKPLNPILGETVQYVEERTGCTFVAEQVSHHPPLTAFYIYHNESGISLSGNLKVSAKLGTNSIGVTIEGSARLTLREREVYILNPILPPLRARGILLGTKRNELYGNVRISCPRTGFDTILRFNPKGSKVLGQVYELRKRVTSLEGCWQDKVKLEERKSCKNNDVTEVLESPEDRVLFDFAKVRTPELQTRVDSKQDEKDSDSIWGKTMAAIRKNDFEQADIEKRKVEQLQRAEAQERVGTHSGLFFELNPQTGVWEHKE